jgi:hypothetical protein
MKWQIKRVYWKVVLTLGAIGAFVLAAGAGAKWR